MSVSEFMRRIAELMQSRTVIAAVVSAIASALAILNIDFGVSETAMEPIYHALAAIGAVLAVIFRARATRKIGGGDLE